MSVPTITYLGGSVTTLLSTGLNSLANNGLAVSSLYTMSPANYVLAEVELLVTYGSAPTANTGVSVWFCRSVDGTNYEDGFDASLTPGRAPDVVFPLRAVTTAQRVVRRVAVPPGAFYGLAKNDGTGQSMAASGNTLKILPATYQVPTQ